MVHRRMALFPHLSPRCLFTFLLLWLPMMDSGPFEVLGPMEPILALVGEDAKLPCHLSPGVSAERMELRWFRNTFSPAVLVQQDGREQEQEQMPEYQGRVTLVQDNIASGHVAVKIHRVRTFDEGVYGCSFRDKQVRGEAFMHLKVAALGSDPHISVEIQENGQIRLECTSAGWYPEPQVQWRTTKGEELSSTSESRTPDEEGLFAVAASVIISDNSIGNVSCRIHNLLLGQQKEAGISIPAPPIPIWISLLWFAVFLALSIGAFSTWKLCRERSRGAIEWESARNYSVDVSLDRDTAYPHLFLYEDSKSVRLEDSCHNVNVPDNIRRFDTWPCVLGRNTFTEGQHYWEVKVEGRTDWLVGVCKESVPRKGFILMTPINGFWVIELSGRGYWALTPPRVRLSLAGALHRVGIFLDCDSRTVSFYNVNDRSHIYTFTEVSSSVFDPLRPLFCLWSCDEQPLTICSVVDRPPQIAVYGCSGLLRRFCSCPSREKSLPAEVDLLSEQVTTQSSHRIP